MNTGSIYALICPVSGEPRYIGQTTDSINDRLSKHKARFLYNLRKDDRYRKNHKDAWFFSLYKLDLLDAVRAELVVTCPVDELDAEEMYWIAECKRHGMRLTNTTPGGSQPRNYTKLPHTEEAKQAISDGGRVAWERLRSDTTKIKDRSAKRIATNIEKYGVATAPMSVNGKASQRAKLSAANTGEDNPFHGRNHSAEAIAKQSAAKKDVYKGVGNPFHGKQHDDDAKAKIKAARAAQVVPSRVVYLYQYGSLVTKFVHMDELMRYFPDIKKRSLYDRITKGTRFGDGYRLSLSLD